MKLFFFISLCACLCIQTIIPSPLFYKNKSIRFEGNTIDPTKGSNPITNVFSVLYALQALEKNKIPGIVVNFGKSGPCYNPALGDNWWQYYFKKNSWGTITHPDLRAINASKQIMQLKAQYGIDRHILHYLFTTYIGLQDELIKAAQPTVKQVASHNTIGVYYEYVYGHDTNALFANILKTIEVETKKESHPFIFLSTNDSRLEATLKKIYKEKLITLPHTSIKGDMQKTSIYYKFLFTNLIVLSHCKVIISNEETHSPFVSILNPDIPVIILKENCLSST